MMKDVVEMGALIVSLVVSLVLSSALPIHAEQSHPMRVDTAIDTQLEPYAPHIAVQGRMTVAGSRFSRN